jgi:hypothetical protein
VVYIQPQNTTAAAVQFLQALNVDPNTLLTRIEPLDADSPIPKVGMMLEKSEDEREEKRMKS